MGLKRRILGFFTFLFITIFSAHAMAVEYPFIMTTTPDTSKFSFDISAAGTFYVDWGDGKTETINKTTTSVQTISHTYATANEYVIKLGGKATEYIYISDSNGYSSDDSAINFHNNLNLGKIDGSLGMIFSTLSDNSQPTFQYTFYDCINLTGSIPKNLFAGIAGAPANAMFASTFSGCSGLTSIPENLFAGIKGEPAEWMFSHTFEDCSNLSGPIPQGLFGNLTGSPAKRMFLNTFMGCSKLSGPIPQGLFGNLTGKPAEGMFWGTFNGCSKLSGSIPEGLFGNLTGAPADAMFSQTFRDCSKLEGFIPPTLFAGIDTPDVATANGQMSSVFANSGIVTQCPVGYYQYMTGFEKYFDDRVSCTPCPTRYTNAGPGLTSESQCVMTVEPGYYIENPGDTEPTICPAGSYCAGGDVPYGDTISPTTCPENSSSEPGAIVCTCNNGFINNGGTTTTTDACISDYKFFMTTTPDTTEFSFDISAAGTFYIDWGDNTPVQTINKNNIETNEIAHVYTTPGKYVIKIGGNATDYQDARAAISFYNNKNLAQVSGSLGAVFATLPNGKRPQFGKSYMNTGRIDYGTFENCTNLNSISENLFTEFDTNGSIIGGVHGAPVSSMFRNTFYGCSGLTGPIPEKLFAGIIGAPANRMFESTFYGCSGLTDSIPENLFAGISGVPTESMFFQTFYGCSGLSGTIPKQLFNKISGTPAPHMFASTFLGCSGLTSVPGELFVGISGTPAISMFSSTFEGCTGLSGAIPEDLFKNISGTPAENMFFDTFYNCSGLTSIPENLFAGISGLPAVNMFNQTFYGCSGLTGAIPEKLFENISGTPAEGMFSSTFYGCSGLTEPIPAKLFGGISGAPAKKMFSNTFYGCKGLTGSIPEGLFAGITGEPAENMFSFTFYRCSNLSGSIPEKLFGGISGKPAPQMFMYTFYGCSKLSNFIPPMLFKGIEQPSVSIANNQMTGIFGSTGIDKQCPVGFYQYITGFEDYFSTRVSCTPCPTEYTNAGPGLTSESQCVMTVDPGYYIENPGDTEPTICPNGSYCTGGDMPYGQTGPINPCPAITNPYGALDAAVETSDGLDSIDQCTGGYSFAEKFFADTLVGALGNAHKDYDPESNANKRGTYLVFCNYNSETDNYDIDCTGISLLYGCANGHYFSNTEQVDWSQFPTDENAAISTDTLEQAIEQVCAETDIDYWSPGLQDCYDKYTTDDDINKCIEPKVLPCINSTDDNCPLKTLWSQHACPENSSTRGLTGQEYCTCDDKYTVDGTANGPTTTMYDACIRAEVTITYDVNGGNGAIESHKCLAYDTCDIKTPSQIGHDMYRAGYVFDGWALNPGDTTPIDYQYTFNENTTVYAIWTPCTNGTYKTADANAGDQCSACSDLGTEYTFTEIASTSANQCRAECLEHSIIYGTAIPLEQYKFWPNKCEYRGVSVTGNPCDIIDGECIETSCNYNYEMINGRCQACNREHALTYKPTGNCVVETCGYGYHADGQYCVGDTKACSAPNAISAHQVWDTKKNAFSECLITECESGYHVSENVCQLDDQTCELEHGTGEREWDDKTNSWGKCVATYCEPGYTNDPSLTNENWEQCGRCNNMYTTDGVMAVSSYVQGCEIASCMNQGEQFILDGDECRLICDEYSDETGRRYWDGKKCVHECTNGYTQW